MRRQDFHYTLPGDLIAKQPTPVRSASRLLHLAAAGGLFDRRFADLVDLLGPGDLLVMNDTRVVPARLFGVKASGGRVEILVERMLGEGRVLAQVRASKSPKPGGRLHVEGGVEAEIIQRHDDLFELLFHDERPVEEILRDVGHVPLPPYIDRPDVETDAERYQTVYANSPGAVAAPTAGLHFDDALLRSLADRGVEQCHITLHVGAGTFQPVRVNELDRHRMHSEQVEVGEAACAAVAGARERGGRVVAVGTTSVRALEAATGAGGLRPFRGETDLFITPGYEFRSVDALITNFHLPESTLLMLTCAFGGMQRVLDAYAHAVEQRYRFYSYGDAMFIEPLS